MQDLIKKVRQAAHIERRTNREATELQLYALELASMAEKYLYPLMKIKLLVDRIKIFFHEDINTSELQSRNRYYD